MTAKLNSWLTVCLLDDKGKKIKGRIVANLVLKGRIVDNLVHLFNLQTHCLQNEITSSMLFRDSAITFYKKDFKLNFQIRGGYLRKKKLMERCQSTTAVLYCS